MAVASLSSDSPSTSTVIRSGAPSSLNKATTATGVGGRDKGAEHEGDGQRDPDEDAHPEPGDGGGDEEGGDRKDQYRREILDELACIEIEARLEYEGGEKDEEDQIRAQSKFRERCKRRPASRHLAEAHPDDHQGSP